MDQTTVYLNGKFVAESDARVSVMDRGFNGGEGVYDVTRTFGGVPFKLSEHVDRLYRSMKYCRIDCGLSSAEMEGLCLEVLARNKQFLGANDDYAIWKIVSRGVQQSGIMQKGSGGPTIVIYCLPVAFKTFARNYIDGVPLIIPSTRRVPPQSLEAKAKITNKMNHVLALHEAKLAGDDCIPLMLDVSGNVCETHMGNFFFVSNGTLYTPTTHNILGGVTRTTILALAKQLGIPTVEGVFTPYDVYTADEAFTSSTSPTIGPVRSLNGVPIGQETPGRVTLLLIRAWSEMVGIDIVAQALSHLDDRDRQRTLGVWSTLRAA